MGKARQRIPAPSAKSGAKVTGAVSKKEGASPKGKTLDGWEADTDGPWYQETGDQECLRPLLLHPPPRDNGIVGVKPRFGLAYCPAGCC